MELWPGIHSLDASRVSNVYLVMGPPVTLIDTGPPGALPRILAGLHKAGVRPATLQRIVLTHCDVDHIGNAYSLSLVADAEICAPEDDAPYITGERGFPGPALRHAIDLTIGRRLPRPRVDRTLREGDDLDGLIVRHLPGHTPGHSGLQRAGVLFAGDTLFGGRMLSPAPGVLTWNKDEARRSIARIGTLEIDLLLPGHGTPVNDGSRRAAALDPYR